MNKVHQLVPSITSQDFTFRMHPRNPRKSQVLFNGVALKGVREAGISQHASGGFPLLTLKIYGAKIEILDDSISDSIEENEDDQTPVDVAEPTT